MSKPESPKAKLNDMLLEKVGDLYTSPQGKLDVRKLARDLGLSYQAVYGWISNNRLQARQADRVISLVDGRLTKADFLPFMY